MYRYGPNEYHTTDVESVWPCAKRICSSFTHPNFCFGAITNCTNWKLHPRPAGDVAKDLSAAGPPLQAHDGFVNFTLQVMSPPELGCQS